ncbi:MAG: hypothetical protein K9H48_12300 [Melioribacteraceae bacterium]|nr:hypothetical protein [Melioribacteraceae bacterium]MCF8395077.1 hypothetical protein [Melioribacteraceae bacterium]MCF8420376.1 hypothetical protein [Melioribacteraceae bacterium]
MQKKLKKHGWIKYLLFLLIFILLIIFLRWCSDSPDTYTDDIELEFKGRVTKKYFRKTINLNLDVFGKKINIAGLSDELENNVSVGDSLIKYKNSNCCLLVKDTIELKLKYIFIPESVLERSEYLRKIYEHDCD